MALGQTLQSILDINRKRRFFQDNEAGLEELNEELRVLNAVVENHARVLKSYEYQLERPKGPSAGAPISI
ncbi:hypothetical protein [Neolewinella antarctica]|uniref:Uncharacterized protein n=1 Tax=Neolewinella antarctica TaxID=442734 RepID=A0ABX0X9W8_9BACT|nr:hypothetical protein [Neolewinella antarctica]NJC25739.1 hypothetical protein [Neolewinella antarctica]